MHVNHLKLAWQRVLIDCGVLICTTSVLKRCSVNTLQSLGLVCSIVSKVNKCGKTFRYSTIHWVTNILWFIMKLLFREMAWVGILWWIMWEVWCFCFRSTTSCTPCMACKRSHLKVNHTFSIIACRKLCFERYFICVPAALFRCLSNTWFSKTAESRRTQNHASVAFITSVSF